MFTFKDVKPGQFFVPFPNGEEQNQIFFLDRNGGLRILVLFGKEPPLQAELTKIGGELDPDTPVKRVRL